HDHLQDQILGTVCWPMGNRSTTWSSLRDVPLEEQWELALLRNGGAPQSDGIHTENLRDAIDEAVGAAATCFERVTMLGPEKVEEAAYDLLNALYSLRTPAWNMSGTTRGASATHDAWTSARRSTDDARPEFVTAVRDVLQRPPKPHA
ncbi:hypothetical protein ACFU6I_46565, partial [Streptomyces sp. NPDC057486]|uniref:hypothetical protein n=1 Tax=Streptomyces sp. NPDC057486 TaxID=3346145 RepID=UPI0036ABCD77